MNDDLKDIMNGVDEDKLQKIARSDEGRQLRKMIDSAGIQSGDVKSLKNAVAGLLKTDAGATLANRIAEMMNGK